MKQLLMDNRTIYGRTLSRAPWSAAIYRRFLFCGQRPLAKGWKPVSVTKSGNKFPHSKGSLRQSGNHHIITVNDLFVGTFAQNFGYLARPQPFDSGKVLVAVVGQSAGDFRSVGPAEGHDVAFGKVAVDLDNPRRQQAAAFRAEWLPGPQRRAATAPAVSR